MATSSSVRAYDVLAVILLGSTRRQQCESAACTSGLTGRKGLGSASVAGARACNLQWGSCTSGSGSDGPLDAMSKGHAPGGGQVEERAVTHATASRVSVVAGLEGHRAVVI